MDVLRERMDASPLDIVIFAPLAPICGVILFWFIQLLFIESQKYLLSKIRARHEPLCRFTNFLGIFFQTICHALGYTVTKSGIASFYLSVDYGKVSPKKEKKGVFEWVSNTFLFVGPFFLPASFLMILLYLLAPQSFIITSATQEPGFYIFANQMITFGSNLYTFSEGFFGFLFTMDLFHPGHVGFLLILIFLGMGIRPSYIAEKKVEKVDMMYDLNNIKNHLMEKPHYMVLLFLFCYMFFYVSLALNNDWYVRIFSGLGWLSIIAIVSLLITHALLLLVKATDPLPGFRRWLPFLMLPLSYAAFRGIFFIFPTDISYSLSLLGMILLTLLVVLLLRRQPAEKETNRFKTGIDMKSLRKLTEGDTNGRRRIIRK
jgi:hypothetical protein